MRSCLCALLLFSCLGYAASEEVKLESECERGTAALESVCGVLGKGSDSCVQARAALSALCPHTSRLPSFRCGKTLAARSTGELWPQCPPELPGEEEGAVQRSKRSIDSAADAKTNVGEGERWWSYTRRRRIPCHSSDYWNNKMCKTCQSWPGSHLHNVNRVCTSCDTGHNFIPFYESTSDALVGVCLSNADKYPGLSLQSDVASISGFVEHLSGVAENSWTAEKVNYRITPDTDVDANVKSFVMTSFGATHVSLSSKMYEGSGGCTIYYHSAALAGWAKVTVLPQEADANGNKQGQTYKHFEVIGLYVGYFKKDGVLIGSPLVNNIVPASKTQECCTAFSGTIKAHPSWLLDATDNDFIGRSDCFLSRQSLAENNPHILEDLEAVLPISTLPL